MTLAGRIWPVGRSLEIPALGKSQCFEWFKKCKSGDFVGRNEERGRPPKKLEDSKLQALLDEQQHLADQLNVTREAIFIRFKTMGKMGLEHEHFWEPQTKNRPRDGTRYSHRKPESIWAKTTCLRKPSVYSQQTMTELRNLLLVESSPTLRTANYCAKWHVLRYKARKGRQGKWRATALLSCLLLFASTPWLCSKATCSPCGLISVMALCVLTGGRAFGMTDACERMLSKRTNYQEEKKKKLKYDSVYRINRQMYL
ncbi:mariner Mos1 transposase [Caerostris darwini]|uniref:Mariner Mos1 transposase n=1 Tax=Caerostris darwini TaxID=1538125 RepID=A0AAV4RX39_9ARAC|nr:mariner Mos1 transposase [Caerostris darwini]